MRLASTVKAILPLPLLIAALPAGAAMPVIDVAAIRQLATEVSDWQEQLQQMRLQLSQMQQTRAALTGARGMDAVLPVTLAARNYLPVSAADLAAVVQGGTGIDPAITALARAMADAGTVATAADIARLSPAQQETVSDEREGLAAAQALMRAAYVRSSDRFGLLATLIQQIRSAPDAKAIAELQGRIAAEQAMLANETIKLSALAHVVDADRAMRDHVRRETALHGHGTFAARFQPSPPVP
jgi:type IV secretion system protein VirB5